MDYHEVAHPSHPGEPPFFKNSSHIHHPAHLEHPLMPSFFTPRRTLSSSRLISPSAHAIRIPSFLSERHHTVSLTAIILLSETSSLAVRLIMTQRRSATSKTGRSSYFQLLYQTAASSGYMKQQCYTSASSQLLNFNVFGKVAFYDLCAITAKAQQLYHVGGKRRLAICAAFFVADISTLCLLHMKVNGSD